ncbi:MAG: hypothetical protein KC422_04205 [Trueperaceae bacterium]|nr:hypothetical protein [Trueperaceae bacterium]
MSDSALRFQFLETSDLSPQWPEELSQLWTLKEHYEVSATLIVPASMEELFYRSNNLAAQLLKLFKEVDFSDPDEDDIEELEPQALALFKKHFLLDEVIDPFYAALKPLAAQVQVRRAGETGLLSGKGRPTLLAIKELWARPWSFETIVERLERTQSIAVEARPILIQAVSQGEPISHPSASKLLGQRVKLALDAEGKITRVFTV